MFSGSVHYTVNPQLVFYGLLQGLSSSGLLGLLRVLFIRTSFWAPLSRVRALIAHLESVVDYFRPRYEGSGSTIILVKTLRTLIVCRALSFSSASR